MIKYHNNVNGIKIAEIDPGCDLITTPEEMLDLMANVGYNDCNRIIIHENIIHQDFFDLKTGLAGEILQKFSNYRMRLAIVGDFSETKSKSLRDFIRESNSRGVISFVESVKEGLSRLDK